MKYLYQVLSTAFISLTSIVTIQSNLFAQTFQNDNSSCEDVVVIGKSEGPPANSYGNPFDSHSISCLRANDDSSLGHPDFPDCITQRDPIPINDIIKNSPSNSFLINSGAHEDNCVNAGGKNKQFKTVNYINSGFILQETGIIRMGSIQSGNLDNKNFEDIAWVNVNGPTDKASRSTIQSSWSEASGGFSPDTFVPHNAALDNENTSSPFSSAFFGGFDPLLNQDNSPQQSVEPNMLLLDCDNDGLDEAALAMRVTAGLFFDNVSLKVLENSGQGLEDANATFSFPDSSLSKETLLGAALSSADFNGDGQIDIIISLNNPSESDPLGDSLVLCTGDGACGFNCKSDDDSNIFDLTSVCGGDCAPFPISLSSGDFNGDGRQDVAVSSIGAFEIDYIFNNGSNFSDWQGYAIVNNNFKGGGLKAIPKSMVLAKGRFTSTAIQNNIDELVATVIDFSAPEAGVDFSQEQLGAVVILIPSDGQGGFLETEYLHFTPENPRSASGLTVADFDHCGGDDIIALVGDDSMNARYASVFLNRNEAPSVSVNPTLSGEASVELNIEALCTDPSNDQREFSWSIVSAPANAKIELGKNQGQLFDHNSDASTSFRADQIGDYTLKIDCLDFCKLAASRNVKISLIEAPPPASLVPTFPSPIPPSSMGQGGCIASSLVSSTSYKSSELMWMSYILTLSGLALWKRKRKETK